MKQSVTIGIPCFNSERWIKQAVDSALALSWADKEVIVVDDGSTDSSPEILRAYGGQIQVSHSGHRGANHARNHIMRQAKGTWIQYLDADDFLLPGKITAQFAESGNGSGCDVIYSPTWIEENGERRLSELDPKLDIFSQWLAWQLPQTGGGLWRKEALQRLNGWNEEFPCCQEHELYLRALTAGLTFHFAPTANAVYRIWSNETLCRRDPANVIKVKTALIDDLRGWMEGENLWTNTHREVAARACFEMARTLATCDLSRATRYHRTRRQAGLISPTGPAAPDVYRLVYHLAGFAAAERVARSIRRRERLVS